MNLFAGLMGGFESNAHVPVARPYFCVDALDGTAKLFVAQWCKTDVQFSTHFMNGKVDMRVIDNFANAIATLNLESTDASYNENTRSSMQSMIPLFRQISAQLIETPMDQSDACAKYCKDIGLATLEKIIDGVEYDLMEARQVLCHNDTKQFNVLVEPLTDSGAFGPTGNFALCDWEMSIKGRSGRDVGIFLAWPVACIFCHAVRGNKHETYHMLDACNRFWDKYAQTLAEKGGKDEEYLVDALQGAFGGCYLYLHLGFYALGINNDDLPIEGLSAAKVAEAKGSMGLAATRMAEMAYTEKNHGYSFGDLKAFFQGTIMTEIEKLLAIAVASHDEMQTERRSSETLVTVIN